MLPRVLSVGSLALASAWLLSSCAAKATSTAAEVPAPADTTKAPTPPPAEALFQASAPNEVVTEATLSRRRSAVADMFRLGTISGFQQGPVGVLRTAVGDGFHTSNSRDRQYPRLALAYSTWTAPGSDLVIEIWERGEKIGEFTEDAFLIGNEYSTPRACSEPGPGGICGYAEGAAPPPPAAPGPVATGRPRAVPPPTAAEPNPDARGHRGIHVNLGLGAGMADISCEGCDFDSETALSGFIGAGTSVSDNTLVGVEATGWRSSDDGADATLYSLMATVTNYVEAKSSLVLTGGIGLIGYSEDLPAGNLTAKGVGYSARLGYEFRTPGRLSFTPYLAFLSTFGAVEFKGAGVRTGEFNFNNIQAGVAIGLN